MFGQFVEKRESMQTNNKMAVAPVGNRHRADLDACDLSGRLFCAANSRAYPQAVHFAQQKDGNKAVLHRHSRNLEYCAPISFDFGAQCNFGGIFRSVYSGFGNILQIADIHLSSG